MQEIVRLRLEGLVSDVSQYSLHSFRAGGATQAAEAGIPDRCFKKHGRWASENAKDRYVEESLQTRLEVTKKLGL